MRTWLTLVHNYHFLILWTAMLVSTTGTFLLLLPISAHLIRAYSSSIGAVSVLTFQWALPVLLASGIRSICNAISTRQTIISSDLINCVLSLAIGILLAQGWVIPALSCLLLRGFFEAVTKTSRIVLVKHLFHGQKLGLAVSAFNFSYYLGGLLGGCFGCFLINSLSLLGITFISAGAFFLSAVCYAFLPHIQPQKRYGIPQRGALTSAMSIVANDRVLMTAFGYLCLSIGVFQGFHNAARTILPIRVLALPDIAMMQLQITSGIASMLAALVASLIPKLVRKRYFSFIINLLSSIFIYTSALTHTQTELLLFYFMFIFMFELALTTAQSKLIQACCPGDIVNLTTGSNALGMGLLIVCALLSGWLADLIPFRQVALLMAVLGLSFSLLIELRQCFAMSHPT